MKSFILQIFACFLLSINYSVLFIFRNASLGGILELTLKLLLLDFVLPVYPWHYYLFIIFLMFIRTSGLLLTNYIIIFFVDIFHSNVDV